MRKLVYVLTNGTVVNTLREAQMSGQGYTATCEEIPPQPSKLSPLQKARRIKIN